MAKNMRKIIVTITTLALLIGLMSVSALAAPGNGTGQTQVHIHGVEGLAPNKSEVVIIVDGKEYSGTLQGSKLTLEMDSTDNGFDFGKDESMEVGYRVGDETGTLTLTHKEGNGNNVGKEHDEGLNNFNGTVNAPIQPQNDDTTGDDTTGDDTIGDDTTGDDTIGDDTTGDDTTGDDTTGYDNGEPLPEPGSNLPTAPRDDPEVDINNDNGDPLPEPGSNLPTAPRDDPEVEIEVLPGNDTPSDETPEEPVDPPYVPEYEFPVIPPVVDEPVVEIEEPEVPLAEVPEVEETEELTEEILDEEVPLAEVPYTGSLSILWIALSCLSAAALVVTGAKRKQ